jgi:hypothetical protein
MRHHATHTQGEDWIGRWRLEIWRACPSSCNEDIVEWHPTQRQERLRRRSNKEADESSWTRLKDKNVFVVGQIRKQTKRMWVPCQ